MSTKQSRKLLFELFAGLFYLHNFLFISPNDSALGQIVGRHLDGHLISG